MARKRKQQKSKASYITLICCVVLLSGFGNWFVHLPSAQRAQWGGAQEFLEEVGSWTCGLTDALGLTGVDAAIPYTDAVASSPIPLGAPMRMDASKVPNDIILLKRLGYWVAYSPTLKHPVWVAYSIPSKKLMEYPPERPPFSVDKEVASARPADYTGSGYDRGHMAPNYLIATRYGKAAQKETFLMSNIVPQLPELNRNPWRALEHVIADDLSAASERTWVITGTVPAAQTPRPTLKKGNVAIPQGFYKVLLSHHKGRLRVLAFYMEQTAGKRTRPRFSIRSVDEIERLSGLDFFPLLSVDKQAALESVEPTRYW